MNIFFHVVKLTCEKSVFDSAGLVSTNARTKCVIQVTGGDGGATGSWGPFGFDGKRPRRPRKLSVRTTKQVLGDDVKNLNYILPSFTIPTAKHFW